ncbi:MAG: phosphatidylinositol mannoside acyltransferase [Candidatus Nanopelagicales bacterium]
MNLIISSVYGLAWFLVKRLPNKITLNIFRKIADYSYRKDIKGVQQLRANLSFMLNLNQNSIELEKIVKEGMRSYLRYWQEAFRLPKWDKNYLEKNIRVKGMINLNSAQKSGKPLVTAVAHMGNWDAAGFWYTNNFGPLTTVAERLKPESLFNRFVRFRNSFGVEIIPTSGETDIFMKLVRRAKEGRMIALVADRDISKNGIEINYGQAKTTFPVGPAAIVTTVDGLILPMSSYYDFDEKLTFEFFPPLAPIKDLTKEQNVLNLTQELASVFESEIKKHPKDWHLLQRVWKEVLPLKRLNNDLVGK